MKVLQLGKTVFDVESDVQSNVSFRSTGAAEVGWRSNHCATSPLTDLAGEAPLPCTSSHMKSWRVVLCAASQNTGGQQWFK